MKTFLFSAALLIAPGILSQSLPKPSPTSQGTPADDATPCPIHLDEAYITVNSGSIPAQAEAGKPSQPRTMHVGVENASQKTILSFVTRVTVSSEPITSETQKQQHLAHTWTGTLAAASHEKEEWKFMPEANETAVSRVVFTKVKFEDGTIWNRTPGDACSFRVQGRMVPAHTPSTQP